MSCTRLSSRAFEIPARSRKIALPTTMAKLPNTTPAVLGVPEEIAKNTAKAIREVRPKRTVSARGYAVRPSGIDATRAAPMVPAHRVRITGTSNTPPTPNLSMEYFHRCIGRLNA